MPSRNAILLENEPPQSGCQFIAVEKRHYTDTDKCRLPQRLGSPFCPAHHALAFMVPAESQKPVTP